MIMTAEKSHHLPSASWRTRRAGGVIQSESEDLRTRRTDVQGQEQMDVPAQSNRDSKFCFPLPFGSILAISGMDDATRFPEGDLYSVHCLSANLFPETPSRAHLEIMFY